MTGKALVMHAGEHMTKPTYAMATELSAAAHRRARQVAAADGLKPAAWLRRLILVASHDGESGRLVRTTVAAALATGEVKP